MQVPPGKETVMLPGRVFQVMGYPTSSAEPPLVDAHTAPCLHELHFLKLSSGSAAKSSRDTEETPRH